MGIYDWEKKKIKKMDLVDWKLVKLGIFLIALLLAKLYAPILSLDWY